MRPEDPHGGQRVTLLARLGPARLPVQVDVGIGDGVTPEPAWLEYPSLLDQPRPRLRAYRPATAIAEQVRAMVVLGSKNSRMRDFFDVHALAMHRSFDGTAAARALRTTFERRRTEIPTAEPLTVTPAFVEVEGKRAQCAVGRLSASQSAQGPYQPQSRDRRACRFRRPGAHGGWARRAIHGNLAARWALGGDVVTLTKNDERHAGQRRFRPYPEYAARSVVSRNCRAPNNCMELPALRDAAACRRP